MTTERLNYLNIGLMLLSCIIAFLVPFELVLFSYIILGPLHYLTEISWLKQRDFFTLNRSDFRILLVLAFFIVFPTLFRLIYHISDGWILDSSLISQNLRYYMGYFNQFSKVMIFVVFAVSALLILVDKPKQRMIGIALIIIIGLVLRRNALVNIAFAIFIPSLIHVYIFTGAFILLGALRGKSRSGILSLIVFVLCAVSFFVLFRHPSGTIQEDVRGVYDFGFYNLNKQIFASFLHQNANGDDIYLSATGIVITRFIAYAYTYHYLNWFSKTSVIGWHLIPRKTVRTIIIIWIGSIILYFSNYRSGFSVLYFHYQKGGADTALQ